MNGNRILVFGSRSLYGKEIKAIILSEFEKNNGAEIVTAGEPTGACEMAREVCRENSIPLKLYFLNFKYLRGAYHHRSKDALADCDIALFLWDGKSRGTSNEMALAKKVKVTSIVHKLKPDIDVSGLDLTGLE